MLISDLCDYNDIYIVVTGKVTVTNPDNNANDKKLAFKYNVPFTNCVSKANNTLIDDAYILDIFLNTVKTIEKQQEVYGIIPEMSQIVVLITTE